MGYSELRASLHNMLMVAIRYTWFMQLFLMLLLSVMVNFFLGRLGEKIAFEKV